MKPFSSVEEYEKFEEDLCKLPHLDIYANTSLKRTKVKKGVNTLSERFDSFAEYTLVTYMRTIKMYLVERNQKTQFLSYVDQNGKVCKFYPDFTINGRFAEVKGRMNEKDHCKLTQCHDVDWYFQDDINKMAAELDKVSPEWRANFIRTN